MLPIFVFTLLSFCFTASRASSHILDDHFARRQVDTRMLRQRMVEGPARSVRVPKFSKEFFSQSVIMYSSLQDMLASLPASAAVALPSTTSCSGCAFALWDSTSSRAHQVFRSLALAWAKLSALPVCPINGRL